jgi:phytoene synthase
VTTLDESYARCRRLTRAHGMIYYASTLLLPRVKRHHVHALYGFCRSATEIVAVDPTATVDPVRALDEYGERFFNDLDRGDTDDAVLKAVVHTVLAFDINPDCFRRYLRSISMDLTVTEYETFDDLLDYMDGSAAVIGEMLLPILEPTSAESGTHARDLGIACQLAAFLREIGSDLDRGHVYLPQEDLRRFGVDPGSRQVDAAWRELIEFEVRRTRDYFASGDVGIGMLPPSSARCVRAIRDLYLEVLERVVRADGDVFSAPVRVPVTRKALVMGRNVVRRARA